MSKHAGRHRRLALGIALAVFCSVEAVPPAFAAMQQEDLSAFRDQVSAAQRAAGACAANATACDGDAVPADENVNSGAAVAFNANWGWLREAMEAAKKQPAVKRAQAMQAAQDHLAELAREAASPAPSASDAANFGHVRQTANSILARGEFQAAAGPGWLDRQIAKFEDWLGRAFMGMEGIGARNPWIAPVIEWALFGAAAGGLVLFVRRSLARQTLRIALGDAAAAARRSKGDATDWARLAEERAAARDWREAVHCLYWAAIVSLEARNAWRPNPTRTPREYLRLLRPGSEAQRLLRELTGQFERVWYGHRAMTGEDCRAAQASFARIKAADLRASSRGGGDLAGRTAAAGAS